MAGLQRGINHQPPIRFTGGFCKKPFCHPSLKFDSFLVHAVQLLSPVGTRQPLSRQFWRQDKEEGQVWLQSACCQIIEVSEPVLFQSSAAALINSRGVGVSVAKDNNALLQGWPDDCGDMLASISQKEEHLGPRGHGAALQQHLANLVLEVRRSRLLCHKNLVAKGLQSFGHCLKSRGFACAIWPLKGDKHSLEDILPRRMDDGRIGVDESGKGDYFGPLVVAACFVAPWHEAELEGVKDSKKLTDLQAIKLASQIKSHCPHEVLVVLPPKYNEIYAKIKNLNRLLEWGHAKVIEEVLAKQPCSLAISDQFAKPAGLQSVLKRKGLDIKLVSMVRAESDLAVAAASILARAEFLRRMEQLSEEAGVVLPKGAGSPVPLAGRKLVQKLGPEALGRFAKLHFKTTSQILGS